MWAQVGLDIVTLLAAGAMSLIISLPYSLGDTAAYRAIGCTTAVVTCLSIAAYAAVRAVYGRPTHEEEAPLIGSDRRNSIEPLLHHVGVSAVALASICGFTHAILAFVMPDKVPLVTLTLIPYVVYLIVVFPYLALKLAAEA